MFECVSFFYSDFTQFWKKNQKDMDPIITMFDHLKAKIRRADKFGLKSFN